MNSITKNMKSIVTLLILSMLVCCAQVNFAFAKDDEALKKVYEEKGWSETELDSSIIKLLDDKHKSNPQQTTGAFNRNVELFNEVKEGLQALAKSTGYEGTKQYTRNRDANYKASIAYIISNINQLSKVGKINEAETKKIAEYALSLHQKGVERAHAAYMATDNKDKAEEIAEKDVATYKNLNKSENDTSAVLQSVDLSSQFSECPTLEVVRAKYTSGCWACLVIEKISSAFLHAAKKAYSLSQRAGFVLLAIGALLWIVFWGLKNVSSFTQIEIANTLNDLIKFGFQVILAYLFIDGGLPLVKDYFIKPFMGVGAKIAESYWEEDQIKPMTKDYNWEDGFDSEGLADSEKEKKKKEYVKAVTEYQQSLKKNLSEISNVNPADKEELEEKIKKDAEKPVIKDVPAFLPSPMQGRLTSPFGNRKHPFSKTCKLHAGIDIGAPTGTPVLAAFEGVVGQAGWQSPGDHSRGYGLRLYVNHKDSKGREWRTVYGHLSEIVVRSNAYVNKGTIIAYSGNSGSSTGPHLHYGVYAPGNKPVDPLGITDGVVNDIDFYGTRNDCPNKYAKDTTSKGMNLAPNTTPIVAQGNFTLGNTSYGNGSGSGSMGSTVMDIPNVTYSGPTDIMPASIMNSILGATRAIQNITAENMILGDVLMCYAKLKNGGAWEFFGYHFVNIIMFIEGLFIFCTGLLLTVAIAYYLLDMSFKIGFAVIALPITVGLWPFAITKDKVGVCFSILAKASATFAFFAITTSFTVELTNAVFAFDPETHARAEQSEADKSNTDIPYNQGLRRLYEIYEATIDNETGKQNLTENELQENSKYVADKMAIFGPTFILLLFAFLYSFKLVQSTVPELVNKFFSDKAFGSQDPMHNWGTAATRWAKKEIGKPVGLMRDIAVYQTGNMAKKAVSKAAYPIVHPVKSYKATKEKINNFRHNKKQKKEQPNTEENKDKK